LLYVALFLGSWGVERAVHARQLADLEAAQAARLAAIEANRAAESSVRDGIRDARTAIVSLRTAEQTATAAAAASAATAREVASAAPWLVLQTVVVGPEYSPAAIARRYNLALEELAALNSDKPLDAARDGDRLVVYRRNTDAPPESRGRPNRGRLINGVPMPEGDYWIVRNPAYGYGTDGTVTELVRGFTHVATVMPGAPTPMIGDLSRRYGRSFPPHRSHQSGRDVDFAFYHRDPTRSQQFTYMSSQTLDVERQWELFRYWYERGVLEYLFVDRRLIRALRRHAIERGASEQLLLDMFGPNGGGGIMRHSPGHANHVHVRFVCEDGDSTCRSY
jgi:murein endopeptidase